MRRFNALIKENPELVALVGQADSLTASQKIWNTILPDALKPFTQAGSVNHECLTVYAHNGAVATKIKLLLPSLLTKLQRQGLEVTSIRVEMQVKSSPRKPAIPVRNISPKAASSLSKLANELSGSALGEVLTKLSRRN